MKPIILHGNNTSIWGDSKGRWVAIRWYVNYDSKEWRTPGSYCKRPNAKGVRFISVDVQGSNLPRHVYTDTQVEKEVKAWVEKTLQKRYRCDAITLGWSEYGMQADGQWNFDVNLFRDEPATKKKGK